MSASSPQPAALEAALRQAGDCCRTLGVSVAASLPVSVCMM